MDIKDLFPPSYEAIEAWHLTDKLRVKRWLTEMLEREKTPYKQMSIVELRGHLVTVRNQIEQMLLDKNYIKQAILKKRVRNK